MRGVSWKSVHTYTFKLLPAISHDMIYVNYVSLSVSARTDSRLAAKRSTGARQATTH